MMQVATKSGVRNSWWLENMGQIIDIKKALFQSWIRVFNWQYNVPMLMVPICQSETGEYRIQEQGWTIILLCDGVGGELETGPEW